jgi:hypothetical protein
MSIACGPGDDRASASLEVGIPAAGTYFAWVRFRDNREASSRFQLRLTPPGARHRSQRFRFRSLEGGRALAATPEGKTFCAAYDRGEGRLILLSVPRGLGIDRSAVPALGQLLAHLTRGPLPVEARGDVEWLLNPAGQAKPQQGITPTDHREERKVVIRSTVPVAAARDGLFPDEPLVPKPDGAGAVLERTVPAGGVRIIELRNPAK